ncbi:hypothetical protein O3P69_006847 [Scylla paramamosain]|uniref:Uncharacterized protein n=1 Tax=Scylla paramamosain TaxID=85552 RepID=A0AAW0U4W0_SCYPA
MGGVGRRPAERGGRAWVWAWTWVFLLAWAASWVGRAEGCDMGEMRCHDGSCVSADQYCDGEADCPGGEDEPAHCTREYPPPTPPTGPSVASCSYAVHLILMSKIEASGSPCPRARLKGPARLSSARLKLHFDRLVPGHSARLFPVRQWARNEVTGDPPSHRQQFRYLAQH